MAKNISIKESIEINVSPENIFDFISNVKNDLLWRPEVSKMEVNGDPKHGSEIIEHITIYKFLHIITPVVIKVLNKPNEFIIETPSTHPTWVHCIRSIEKIENEKSIFTVNLSFSTDNLRQIVPFTPPGKLIIIWYKPRMKKYLRKLKRILETP